MRGGTDPIAHSGDRKQRLKDARLLHYLGRSAELILQRRAPSLVAPNKSMQRGRGTVPVRRMSQPYRDLASVLDPGRRPPN